MIPYFLTALSAEQHLNAAQQSLIKILARQRGKVQDYIGHCVSPTSQEKHKLLSSLQRIKAGSESIFKAPPYVYLIVLEAGCYWDFPFTLDGDTIVCTRAFLKNRSGHKLDQVLMHELIHLDQKRRPAVYAKLYRQLGFKQVTDWLDYIPVALQPYLLGNPDGEQYNWVWTDPQDKQQYIPLGLWIGKPITRLLRVSDQQLLRLQQVPEYLQRFGSKNAYHPNEILAEFLSNI